MPTEAYMQLNKCKCGTQEQIISIPRKGAWSYCPNSRWYNFWKHCKKIQHAWFPS